jgi:hypothetical protein
MKNQIFKHLLLFCFFCFFACQKTEIQEESSGVITVEVEGTKYNFNITRNINQFMRGYGIFEAVNNEKKETILFVLSHDTKSSNGELKDFFDPQFKVYITQSRPSTIFILKEAFRFDMKTTNMTITKADFASKTIEGTFSSEAVSVSLRYIKLENGYFKIKMPAWLYQD